MDSPGHQGCVARLNPGTGNGLQTPNITRISVSDCVQPAQLSRSYNRATVSDVKAFGFHFLVFKLSAEDCARSTTL
jgi:hypothetical protein